MVHLVACLEEEKEKLISVEERALWLWGLWSYKGWTPQDWREANMALIKQWHAEMEKKKKMTPNLYISEPLKGKENRAGLVLYTG